MLDDPADGNPRSYQTMKHWLVATHQRTFTHETNSQTDCGFSTLKCGTRGNFWYEKDELTVGIIKLTDRATLVIAKEKGLF